MVVFHPVFLFGPAHQLVRALLLCLQHVLTPLDCTKEACLLDLKLRRSQWTQYPGACAMEYHSTMEIVMECLFGWDKKKQKGKPGVFGTVEAFCEAIEEQGRGTLHGHFLIWIKNFGLLRTLLHSKNKAT